MKLYRLDYLLAAKADRENSTISEVSAELMEFLGIKYLQFLNLRNTRVGPDSRSTTRHLLCLSIFFDVSMDALINPDAKAQIILNKKKLTAASKEA